MTPETPAVRQDDELEKRALECLQVSSLPHSFLVHSKRDLLEIAKVVANFAVWEARQEVAAERQRVIDAINAIGEPLEQGDLGDGFNQGWARAKDLIVAAIRKLGGTE